MLRSETFRSLLQLLRSSFPVVTSGILVLSVSSCVLFGVVTLLGLPGGVFSVGAEVFHRGHLHSLLLFPLYHQTPGQLLVNLVVLVVLSGSLERGLGTVRFLFLFLFLSSTTGFLYSLLDLAQAEVGGHSRAEGFLPGALACVAVTTLHTKMTKGFLCGVSFPTVALPWVLLVLSTALVPCAVLPCNVLGVLVGWGFGKGWCSLLEVSESRAGALEKTRLFRVLGSFRGVKFVPASAELRRKTLLPQINPKPGSYPVQAYAPLASVQTNANVYEGWRNSPNAGFDPTPNLQTQGHGSDQGFGSSHGHGPEPNLGQSCNHQHDHGHSHSHDHGHGHGHGHSHGHSH